MKQLLTMMRAVPWWVYVAALSAMTVRYIEFKDDQRELMPEMVNTESKAAPKTLDKKTAIVAYIKAYKHIAMAEMKRTGIPASITLAQGVLESNHGKSELAKEANNHFGIKCGQDWSGDRYTRQSSEWNSSKNSMEACLSCFRWYNNPEESFKDHSAILTERKWYKDLFKLDKDDYKGWSEGLKTAGYATDPKYAVKLIAIIETYSLSQYDREVLKGYVNW